MVVAPLRVTYLAILYPAYLTIQIQCISLYILNKLKLAQMYSLLKMQVSGKMSDCIHWLIYSRFNCLLNIWGICFDIINLTN